MAFSLELGRTIQVPGEIEEAVVVLRLAGTGPSATTDNSREASGAAAVTSPRGSSEEPRRAPTEEIRFELVCSERVDPTLVEVKAKDYASSSDGSGRARKKIERVIGRSQKARLGLDLSASPAEKTFKVFMEVPADYPPTYTGTSVSYCYKLKVSTLRLIPSKKAT